MRRRREPQHQVDEIYSSSQGESKGPMEEKMGGEDLLVRLVAAFDEVYKVKEWMVALGEASKDIINTSLIGKTFIVVGPAQSGKASLVYWALRNQAETAVVTVDCSLYRTQMQFIQRLTKDLGQKIGVAGLDRRVVANESISFRDLNRIIAESGRPVVILIRHAQRLVEMRKQILLYNLLDWMTTEVNRMVGLVFTTRLVFFVDRLEKRVKSRLDATKLTVVRPEAGNMLGLLVRRVECLMEESKGDKAAWQLYEKVMRCMYQNDELVRTIAASQEVAQKDIVYYLNAMKIVFCFFRSPEEIMGMNERDLKMKLCEYLKESFKYIFPPIRVNLLKTCNYPEYVIMAVICHMEKHSITPFRFKKVYDIYLDFRQRLVTEEGGGSAFMYSKNVLERAVLKLEELKLIELDSRDQALWNCDIKCALFPDDIIRAMREVQEDQKEKLPYFLQQILES